MARRSASSVYFSPNRGAADVLIGFAARTTRTLDCAVYSITHPRIADALIHAHQRGVAVRVLIDKAQAGMKSACDERLEAAGIIVYRDTQSGLMHHKFAISDYNLPKKFAVALGSFNWTLNADGRNAENLIILRMKQPVDAFKTEFEALWKLNAPKV